MSDKFRLVFDSNAKSKKEIQKELKRIIQLHNMPPASGNKQAPAKPDLAGEVRKIVQDKIHDIVCEAIRSARESIEPDGFGEKIPPRELRPNVDYVGKASNNTIDSDELAYASSVCEEDDSGYDIRVKIEEMRRIGQVFYNGYMLRQCAEESLVKQGLFMADVTDDFPRSCFCGIERPIYGAMSADQLRTYFTWRTQARQGIFEKTDKPYIVLYCYELLNKIGVLSSDDAYNRLSAVWEGCREFCPSLDTLIPRWLKDFRAYNNVTVTVCSAEELTDSYDKSYLAILAKDYSGLLDFLMARSGYNIRGSIFFQGNEKLLGDALEPVLKALDSYFSGHDVSMSELLCGRLRKDYKWQPFQGALVDRDRMDGFHTLVISHMERYSLKRREPVHECFEPAPYRNFIGWILKSMESVLRKRTGFRYSIQANISSVLEDFENRERLIKLASAPEFQQIIPDTLNRWCDEHGIFPPEKKKKHSGYQADSDERNPLKTAPAVVEIDISKLAKIRAESDETTRKLIVEEADTIPAENISEMIHEIESDAFEEQTVELAHDYSPQKQQLSSDFSGLAAVWREFAENISADDITLLSAILDGKAEALCRSRKLLPETEYDRINDRAMEYIGDILIENGSIIEDYAADVQQIVSIV